MRETGARRSCTTCSRLPFLLAVAILAAAIGDPLVETIANSGIVGAGYSDNIHTSVIPAMTVGALLALLLLVLRVLRLVRPAGERPIDVARRFAAGSPLRHVPLVYGLQLIVLFIMESAEQAFAGGCLLGGTAWLGGPVLFSLAVHALIGTGCTVLAARAMRAILRRCAVIIDRALASLLDAFERPNPAAFARRSDAASLRCTTLLRASRLGERASPLLQPT